MAQLPSTQHYIFSEETEFEAPVSESVAQNIGEAINYLNDLLLNNYTEFTTPGSHSWIVPGSVTKVMILACGGGGGGGGGTRAVGGANRGGCGGGGSNPRLMGPIKVVGGSLYTINIGAAGSGGLGTSSDNSPGSNGGDGGATTIVEQGDLINGFLATFTGGKGGAGGQLNINTNVGGASEFTMRSTLTAGGDVTNPSIATNGEDSNFARGGKNGNLISSSQPGVGAGGGAGLKNGGAGGVSGGPLPGVSINPTSGGYGGGGGGGYGRQAVPSGNGFAGGNGYMLIAWF